MRGNIKQYNKMRQAFLDKYENKILPTVRLYEQMRRTKLLKAFCISLILACLLMTLFALGMNMIDPNRFSSREIMMIIVECMLLSSLASIPFVIIKKNFENSIKQKIMSAVCSGFENITWVNGKYVGGNIFSASGVIGNYTDEHYDDVFIGAYKDVDIDIVESHFRSSSRKNRGRIFDGVIVKLNMNKFFTGHTVVKPSSIFHAEPLPSLEFTELEDSEFNRQYDVFTNDNVEARYLLTPSFMERLKNMKTVFKANSVSCAFYNNNLIIALQTYEDLFSLCSLTIRIDDNEQYFRMFEEIMSIIKLIDHFKLDQRIGL